MDNQFFVGFGDLEKMVAKVIDPTRPVFADSLTIPGKSDKYGISISQSVVMVQQPVDGMVYYTRIKTGEYQCLNGRPLEQPDKHHEYLNRCEDAWLIVLEWLTSRGLTVLEATVAAPRDLVFLDGWADFLIWDRENKQYRRAEVAEAEKA